jgi:hypothetical protein
MDCQCLRWVLYRPTGVGSYAKGRKLRRVFALNEWHIQSRLVETGKNVAGAPEHGVDTAGCRRLPCVIVASHSFTGGMSKGLLLWCALGTGPETKGEKNVECQHISKQIGSMLARVSFNWLLQIPAERSPARSGGGARGRRDHPRAGDNSRRWHRNSRLNPAGKGPGMVR